MKHSTKIYRITYNNENIDVLIIKKNIKSLRLKINNSSNISLSIPNYYPFYKACDFLNSKLDWIVNNLAYIKERQCNDYSLEKNNKIQIFGKVCNVNITNYKKDKINIVENNLMIFTKNDNIDYVYKKFTIWAKKEFLKIATSLYNQEFMNSFDQYGLIKPKLKVRTMKSMWGNCKYNKGEITLNLYLIKVPINCLRYVIIHEFAHLLFHDHGNKFKEFLTEVMPEWKDCKRELKNYSLNF